MTAEEMVPRGLEPRTLRLLAARSNQLSYETLRRVFEPVLFRSAPSLRNPWPKSAHGLKVTLR